MATALALHCVEQVHAYVLNCKVCRTSFGSAGMAARDEKKQSHTQGSCVGDGVLLLLRYLRGAATPTDNLTALVASHTLPSRT